MKRGYNLSINEITQWELGSSGSYLPTYVHEIQFEFAELHSEGGSEADYRLWKKKKLKFS